MRISPILNAPLYILQLYLPMWVNFRTHWVRYSSYIVVGQLLQPSYSWTIHGMLAGDASYQHSPKPPGRHSSRHEVFGHFGCR
jgi:hypothetical protein